MKRIFAFMLAASLTTSFLGISSFADNSRKISVDKPQPIGRLEEQKGSVIQIKENDKKAWPEKTTFVLKLPSNVKWNDKTRINNKYKPVIDGSVLKVTVDTNEDYQDLIQILPYFDVDRDAPIGELSVLISGGSDNDKDENVVVGKISNYGVNISSSFERVQKNIKSIPVEITLSEVVEDSMLPNNLYTLVLDNADIDKDSIKVTRTSGKDSLELKDVKNNYAEFELKGDSSEKDKWNIKFNITPKAGYTGNINLRIEGKGIDNDSTTVAEVFEGLDIKKSKNTVLELGKQNQDIDDFTISEIRAGALAVGDYTLKLEPNYKGFEFTDVSSNVKIGNIRMSNIKKNGNELKFNVRGESTLPCEIELSNIKATMDRYGYDGVYKLNLVNDKNPDEIISSIDLFTINTKIEQEKQNTDIKFVIDSLNYKVGDEEKTLDVAPYIQGSRTMLPVNATATSLNMQVDWNSEARTVTLKSDNKNILLTIDNKTMIVDGKEITLDVAPEIKNGRTFLPVAQIANTLGVNPKWDNDTKTVTISMNK